MMTRPLSLIRAAFYCLCASAPYARAADRYWANAAGGGFQATSNWSATEGGATGASVPGAADRAIFSMPSLSTFTVNFSANAAVTDVDVNNATAVFEMSSGTCTTSSSSGWDIGGIADKTGRLTVRRGSLLVDSAGDLVRIGLTADSLGALTLGTEAVLGSSALRPALSIGSSGSGSFTVNDGGQAFGTTLDAALSRTGTASLTVSSPNSLLDLSGIARIAQSGSAVMTVNGGALFNSGGGLQLGINEGGEGSLVVTGAGSRWTTAGTTTIGSGGIGTVSVTSGARATTEGFFVSGVSTGIGTVTVSGGGSQWTSTGAATVGNSGIASLTVSGGGHFEGTSCTVGQNSSSDAKLIVTGDGSRLRLSGSLTAAHQGQGSVSVLAGGEASVLSLSAGGTVAGRGEVLVSGEGARLIAETSVSVAPFGYGMLTVEDGGLLHVDAALTINDPAGAPVGSVFLDGGTISVNSFTNNSSFTFRDGLLRVAGGTFQHAPASGPLLIDGDEAGDAATLELLGNASTSNITSVSIGTQRTGALILGEGRAVNTGANATLVGGAAGSSGTLRVETNSAYSTGDLTIGGALSGAGTGLLEVAGARVSASALRVYPAGTVRLRPGGQLSLTSLASLTGQFEWTGGTLFFLESFTLTASLADALLGTAGRLTEGRELMTLNSTGSSGLITFTLASPLTVDGGKLGTGAFRNESTLTLASGSVRFNDTALNTSAGRVRLESELLNYGTFTNAAGGRIELGGGSAHWSGTGTLLNQGLLSGDGAISAPLTNAAGGKLRVLEGDTLFLDGTLAPNAGEINLLGGVLDCKGTLTNASGGFISSRGMLFTAGLTNSGQMAFSAGSTDLFGDVTLTSGSRLATSGAGSVTTFWDDVVHNGTEIFTGAGCSTVFYGAQTGSGSFTGSGAIYYIGDLRPGSSPASVSYAPQVFFTPASSLSMELGGTTPGTQHDQLTFTSSASVQVEWGGELSVSFLSGFVPAAGQTFDLFNFDAARATGTFTELELPALPEGLRWDASALYTDGKLSITTGGVTFAQWAATALGNPAALPSGDHDHDGLANGIEFALGLVPAQAGTVLPVIDLHTYSDGERLRGRFTRPLDRTGVTLRVQTGSDLTAWTDVAVSVDSAPFTGPGFVSENRSHPVTEPGAVEVRDTVVRSPAAPRRQMRLKVEIAP